MLDFWIGRTRAERLWVQSSAQLHTASARAGSTLVCTFCSSSSAAPRRRSARFSAAAALSQAHGSYCHHPHGVRTRASTTRGIGKRARDDLPRRPERQRRCASDSAHTCAESEAQSVLGSTLANRHGLFCRCPLWWRRACARRVVGGNSCRARARASPQRRVALSVGAARPTMKEVEGAHECLDPARGLPVA